MSGNRKKDTPRPDPSGLDSVLGEISAKCIECGLCVKQCGFLRKYGTPKSIADRWGVDGKNLRQMPFACSLCSLCTAVCPVDIDPRQMFLEMRRRVVAEGAADFTKQSRLLSFEKRGTSRLFSFYGLPENCDTVLFPGCALAGTRSQRVMHLYEFLETRVPNLGIVLDCCTKPSHDLGRSDFFHAMFYEMHDYLAEHGVRQVLTGCPSCHTVFTKYSKALHVRSVYEILADQALNPGAGPSRPPVTIQDSCVARFDATIQDSVRKILRQQGVPFEEMKHHGRKTLCCGEGGGADFVAPELAGQWGELRGREAQQRQIITYCAGCANFLGRVGSTAHLLDLIFDPKRTLNGGAKVTKPPWTYLKRLLLKNRFRKRKNFAVTRERDFSPKG